MRDAEIKKRIEGFPNWHYRFDLKGNITPIFPEEAVNRHEQRRRYFFEPLVGLFGGSLRGKRVLDLGCNAGFWSLLAARAGCDYVLGIDGRQMHVDQANFVFEVEEIEGDRYDFVAGNIFEMDLERFGRFDVVLCLGLMYHISKHVELMEKISAVNDDVLLIDTTLARLPGAAFKVWREPLDRASNAVDHEMVMAPSWEAVHELARQFGYDAVALKPRFDDYEGAKDYVEGRRAFLCARATDVSRVSAEVEPAPTGGRMDGSEAQRLRGVVDNLRGETQRLRKEAEISRLKAQRARLEAERLKKRANRLKGRVCKLEGWMRQTDHAVSRLSVSRRLRLANALGDAGRRILRKDRGPTPEERLLAIRDAFRAWSERRDSS